MNGKFFAGVLAMSVCFATAAEQVDGLAATVGSVSILRSDVEHEMRRMGADPSRFDEARNRLIERQLILKAASDAKMVMQEWLVDNHVREVTDEMFDGDRNQLVAALSKEKIPYVEWRKKLRDDMIVGAMRWNMVDKYVTASPAEMKAEFAAHPERYRADATVSVSVILLKPENSAKSEEIDAKLATDGFAALAKLYSSDSHAAEGGVWKSVKPEAVFRPEVCEEIAKLKVGETSHWIDLGGWKFLLRKDAAADSKVLSFAEAYDDIEAQVKNENAKRIYNEWIERLRSDTFVKIEN